MGKDHRAFGDSIYIAFHAQVAQVIQKGRVEQRLIILPSECCQVGEVRLAKAESAEPLNSRRQPAGNRKPVLKRRRAKEEVGHGFFSRRARLPVAASHGELVYVGQEGVRSPGCI
jgi:hypothetical protein